MSTIVQFSKDVHRCVEELLAAVGVTECNELSAHRSFVVGGFVFDESFPI